MTELIAYRYKERAADGVHELNWTEWRSGQRREEMMTELKPIGKNLVIVQCSVPRAEPDPTNGRENDLWVWTRATGWRKSNARNWYVDTCDPTVRHNPDDDDNYPYGRGRELTAEERDEIRRQVYGTH